MALLVFVTENCTNSAKKHGLLDDVGRFRRRVEESQSLRLFDPFPQPYMVKKKLGGRQGRLVAEWRSVDAHVVAIFLEVMIRGDREYDQFQKDPVGYGGRRLSGLFDDGDLCRAVARATQTDAPMLRAEPSAAEYGLIHDAFSRDPNTSPDALVCETADWVAAITNERNVGKHSRIAELCLNAIDGTDADAPHLIEDPARRGLGVWALRRGERVMLASLSTPDTSEEAKTTAMRVHGDLAKSGDPQTEMLRLSRRAYPAVILTDEELWSELEKETVANLALSPEETQVLESVRRAEDAFPLFINGRAGSGKSTILQYLFTDLLFHYLTDTNAHALSPPIYLTANQELLRVARAFVERLLKRGASWAQHYATQTLETDAGRRVLAEAFRVFRPYVLSLVPPDDAGQRFAPQRQVDFHRFKSMWNERFGKEKKAAREYGPALSWHVVRSHIKGLSSETFLDPDDYSQVPRGQRTVSQAAFARVYDRVWLNWYKEVGEHGFWDDQDLARFVLERDLTKPVHPAVFCDEAQDFTRIELDLLLRINVFSDRSLAAQSVRRVPFAFAGDPFQTLNPTGFRWDAIKTSFVEKFIYELDPRQRSSTTDLNYQELRYNYRSTAPIVRFSNHVQALRTALFGLADIKPQEPWALDARTYPVTYFSSDDNEFWRQYREQSGFVMIVPCGEDEEADFVRNDPMLRQNVTFQDGVPQSVLSPTRAKGCEYPAVLVYGFGDNCPADVTARVSNPGVVEANCDEDLPLEYFVNSLYVAVSRPKKRLIVVDSPDGLKRLWGCACDEAKADQLVHRIKHGERWASQMHGMTAGTPSDFTRDTAPDPLENARLFEQDAIARSDAFLFRQAAQSYRAAGELAKAKVCKARALEADENWLDAAEAYVDANKPDRDAVRCFWFAGESGWRRLAEIAAAEAALHSEIEVVWAQALTGRADPRRAAELLDGLHRALVSATLRPVSHASHSTWEQALAALLERSMDSKTPLDRILAQSFVDSAERLEKHGLAVREAVLARLLFNAERYADAVAIWDRLGVKDGHDYFRARANVEPYPARLIWLEKLGAAKEICEEFTKHTPVDDSLTQQQAEILSRALRAAMRHADAVDAAWCGGAVSNLFETGLVAFSSGEVQLAQSAIRAGLIVAAKNGQWEPVDSLVAGKPFLPDKKWNRKPASDWLGTELVTLRLIVVRGLARSDALLRATTQHQEVIQTFLRDLLRVRDARSWNSTVSIPEAGAAVERAGRHVDALAFYEAVAKEKERLDPKDVAAAAFRWLACKRRHVKYLESRDPGKADDGRREIERAQRELRIADLGKVPEYPELPPLKRPSQALAAGSTGAKAPSAGGASAESDAGVKPQETRRYEFERYRVEISSDGLRCNITDVQSLETGHVKVPDRLCGGEGDPQRVDETTWRFVRWRLVVHLPTAKDSTLVLKSEESGADLVIPAPRGVEG